MKSILIALALTVTTALAGPVVIYQSNETRTSWTHIDPLATTSPATASTIKEVLYSYRVLDLGTMKQAQVYFGGSKSVNGKTSSYRHYWFYYDENSTVDQLGPNFIQQDTLVKFNLRYPGRTVPLTYFALPSQVDADTYLNEAYGTPSLIKLPAIPAGITVPLTLSIAPWAGSSLQTAYNFEVQPPEPTGTSFNKLSISAVVGLQKTLTNSANNAGDLTYQGTVYPSGTLTRGVAEAIRYLESLSYLEGFGTQTMSRSARPAKLKGSQSAAKAPLAMPASSK